MAERATSIFARAALVGSIVLSLLGAAAPPAAAAPFAYIPRIELNDVLIIDTGTVPPSVVGTVAVGSTPYGVAVHPAGIAVYVTSGGGGAVYVIDTTTAPATLVNTVPI